jgi:hypothetical protein
LVSSALSTPGANLGGVTRIYYELDDELHRAAKLAAVTKGISLKAWLIEAITEKLEREGSTKGPESVRAPLVD